MITIKISGDRQTYRAFAELHDLARRRKLGAVMIGPYEDFTLLATGIIIDGADEVTLAEAFDEVLKQKDFVFKRKDDLGILFYKDRSY